MYFCSHIVGHNFANPYLVFFCVWFGGSKCFFGKTYFFSVFVTIVKIELGPKLLFNSLFCRSLSITIKVYQCMKKYFIFYQKMLKTISYIIHVYIYFFFYLFWFCGFALYVLFLHLHRFTFNFLFCLLTLWEGLADFIKSSSAQY